jgi:PAS domain S-box-containing protein
LSWLDRRRTDKEQPTSAAGGALRDVIARHPSAVIVTSSAGELVEASAPARRLFGAQPTGEGEGAEATVDPSARVHDGASFRAQMARLVAAGRPVDSETITLADGRVFERDYAPIEDAGLGTVHFWEYRDVTERVREERARQEAAARLQFLVNLGSMVLYSCRPDGDFDRTFVSENVQELLGHEPASWMDVGFWRRAIHPEDAERVAAEMTILRERGAHTVEYRLRHASGRVIRVRDEMRLVCDSDNRPAEIVGWMTDVTAQPRVDADALGRAAAEMVHDFSNLLLVIAGHAHLLKAGMAADSPARWHVSEIAAAAERATKLTERVRRLGSSAAPEPPAPAPAPPTAKRGEGETVLVVEDEDSVRVFTGRALTGNGYKVLEARRCEEALEIAARYGPLIRAVVTDVSMPGMSGCELAQRLAAAVPQIKVLLMSGYDTADFAEQGQSAALASASFLQKPFTPDMLATRLREVLDN